mgnify:CR=1 FL=1
MNQSQNSPLIQWSFRLGTLCLLGLPLAIIATRLNIINYSVGLATSALTCLGALLIMLLGVSFWLLPKFQNQRRKSIHIVLVTLVPVLIAANTLIGSIEKPAIHDISTDIHNPPKFVLALKERGTESNSLQRDEKVDQLQKQAYPLLSSINTALTPAQAFEKSLLIANDLGWNIYSENLEAGFIEAVDTTLIYGFKDDIVIRIQTGLGTTLVDLRSVSRVGVGDLGANAARIEAFIEAFN